MRHCILIILLFWTAGLFGQTERGNKLVGGDIALTTTKVENEDATTVLVINPSVGYFVADNFTIGGTVFFDVRRDLFQMAMAPFFRYYTPVNLFGEFSIGFSVVKEDGADATVGGVFGFGLGYAAFISDNVAIEPIMRYTRTFGKKTTVVNNILIGVGLQVHLW